MTKYELNMVTEDWECGDGCCSGDSTLITINEVEIGWYGELRDNQFNAVSNMMKILNEHSSQLTLTFSFENDKEGNLEDVIYLNDTKLTNSLRVSELYVDILNKLEIPYRYVTYDYDWDIWHEEKELVLEIENDELRNGAV